MSIGSGPGAGSDFTPGTGPALSQSARRVSEIAYRNGDRDFFVLDKVKGQIIVFENGKPTFGGAALTGESMADRLEPDAIGKTFAEQKALKYKVTPAGRYTVSTGYDPAYGETLDINEIQGVDWDIAIHRVWLGAPSERRDVRLRTPTGQDKHITYGCIDVDAPTMRRLLQRVPSDDEMPIYILPVDDRLIAQLFQPNSVVSTSSSLAR